MTAAAATTAVLVLLHGAVFATIVFVLAFKVTGMTGGTEWRVLRGGVSKRHCDGAAMTCTTAWVASMIPRVVTIRIMPERGRRPTARNMTGITLQIRG